MRARRYRCTYIRQARYGRLAGDPRLDFHPHSVRPHAYTSGSSLVAERCLTDDEDDAVEKETAGDGKEDIRMKRKGERRRMKRRAEGWRTERRGTVPVDNVGKRGRNERWHRGGGGDEKGE